MSNSESDDVPKFPSAIGVATRLACSRAVQEGVKVELLLREAGLTRQQIDDPGVRIDVQNQIRFLELVATAVKDDLLGFHLALKVDLRKMGALYYAQASSDTLEEALQRGVRYSSIVNEGLALSFQGGRAVEINFEYVGVARHSDRHQIEFSMVTLVRTCRQLTKRHLAASRVSFTHRRSADISEFRTFFGCDVTFGAPVDRVVFSKSSREIPLVDSDPYLNEVLIKYCDQAIADRSAKRSSFRLSVENAIAILLPHGKAQAGQIARKLGVSRRTLARRLASEGLTFTGIMQSLKSDLAKRHLTDKTLSVSEVAWLLGYRDASAFTHAFKRWTGKAPTALREVMH